MVLRKFVAAAVCLCLLASGLSGAAPCHAGETLEVGSATVDITPPPGFRMSGYFSERFSTGTKDPLLAKAIVFRQRDVRVAMVFCDLIGINRVVGDNARRLAEDATGIPAASIAIAATHSHTGPLYSGALREYFHERAISQSGADPAEAVDYREQLARGIADAIAAAHNQLRPARLSHGVAQESRLSFNRRFHMRDGRIVCNPGQQNPEIIRPAGPIDPDVGLIQFEHDAKESGGAKERGSGAIVCFALHLDTLGGTLYSADYPGVLQERLREKFGPGFLSLFAAGTCGDINHVDVSISTRRKTEEIGSLLAETVQQGLGKLHPIDAPDLASLRTVVEVPLQQYPDERYAQAKGDLAKVGTRELPALDQVEAVKIVDLRLRGKETLGLEVQVIRFSRDAAIVFLPGEVFVELGLAIKQASPFPTTLVVELTNDSPAYIPTEKAFAEGSYETINSRVVPGSGEKMVEAAVKLLHDLGGVAK